MCGIAGLFSKSSTVEGALGQHLSSMLAQLAERGPDSAGVAFYRDPAAAGSCKVSLFSPDPEYDWRELEGELAKAFGGVGEPEVRASHALFVVEGDPGPIQAWLHSRYPELRVMSVGERIEIYKEAGDPRDFIERFRLAEISATHALGHTRMATESGGHARALAPLHEPATTSASSTTARSPIHNRRAAASCERARHHLPDRQRHRGRVPLTWTWRHARRATASSAALQKACISTTSTVSTRSPSGPPPASPCCATRSPASRR